MRIITQRLTVLKLGGEYIGIRFEMSSEESVASLGIPADA